jgi:Tat protein translocase TatB subunit
MPTSLGPAEILVILIVALIVLGPDRLPKAARQLGKAVGEVRRWSSTVQEDLRGALDPDDDPFPPIAAVPDPYDNEPSESLEPLNLPQSTVTSPPQRARVVPSWVVPLPGDPSPPEASATDH